MANNNRQWVDSDNIARAIESLRRKGDNVVTAAKQAFKQGVGEIVTDAKSRCPVKTGKLRESIHYVEKENGAAYEIIADARNSKGVPYAKIVEYSPKINQPFLFPALDANKTRVTNLIRDAVNQSSAE